MVLKTFLRNSVASIPFTCFLYGLFFQDIKLLLLSFGIGINGILNWILKHIFIHNTRPPGARNCGACSNNTKCDGKPGFPSGHSQIAWFFAIFMICYLLDLSKTRGKNVEVDILSTIILLGLAFTISFSRLGYLRVLGNPCHTPEQVIAGGVLGSVLGYYYYKLISKNI
jgi:membrane-associated phospholipid phosphatase